ncbi:MAG: hypothetical protein QY330_01650 [Candidatus Dojkabacteria bacterium]|nr:MAG: hypothetical protein QY330_01650 [Candidatus Dojkabacteria bacterium]
MIPKRQPMDNRNQMISEYHNYRRPLLLLLIIITICTIAIIPAIKITTKENSNEETNKEEAFTININAENIPTLSYGHYALWSINENNDYNLIKRFNSLNGKLIGLNGEAFNQLPLATDELPVRLEVSIEKEGDRDMTPNDISFMSAPVTNNYSELKFLELELTDISGSYILATPTDGNSEINELSGIWFVRADDKSPSLFLPRISSPKWIYQTRLLAGQVSLDLGRFASPMEPDDSGKYSFTNFSGYNAPGEDIFVDTPEPIEPPINLANGSYQVIVSLEPSILNDYGYTRNPFIALLKGEIELGSGPNNNLNLTDVYLQPIITIRLERNEEQQN